MSIYTEAVNDPACQALNAITSIGGALELLLKNNAVKEATVGGIRTYLRWCATNQENRLGCLALARMVRDELALMDARGDLRSLLVMARDQTERLIVLMGEAVPE